MSETERAVSEAGLVYRIRRPSTPSSPPVLLLHGLGGDEDVMWVFESALPPRSIVVAPRGIYPTANGGASWTPTPGEGIPAMAEYARASAAARGLLVELRRDTGVIEDDWIWIGFSQGAGLAFSAAAEPDGRLRAVVALAGFLPEGLDSEGIARLHGIPVFWGHGSRDDQVPVERARRDVARLREAGLDVIYCEADVGHKLGADCLRGLKAWFTRDGAVPRPPSES